MKLALRLVASILLAGFRAAAAWPYHEIVGVGQSASVLVAPVYGVAPALSLVPTGAGKEAKTLLVAGPVTGTAIVEGSSSGAVTIVSPGSLSGVAPAGASSPVQESRAATVAGTAAEESVLVKGASAGPVTLVAPSHNLVVDADSAAPAEPEAKGRGVAATASASADVAIENAEESSSARASANATATAITGTIGVASANAVIGPSTGPVIVAGPTGPPLPAAGATSTTEPVDVAGTATTSEPATVAPLTVSSIVGSTLSRLSANASASSSLVQERVRTDGSSLGPDATKSTRIESAASSSSTLTTTSGSTAATARVNSITPGAAVAEERASSNVVVAGGSVPSVVVSGPTVSVSAGTVSSLLLKAPLYTL